MSARVLNIQRRAPETWEEAEDRFVALRKAQGAAPRTIAGYMENITAFFKRYSTAWSSSCRDCLLAYLSQEGISPATYNVRLKVLHPFFRFCVDEGAFDRNPAEGLKYRRQEPRIVDHPEDHIRKIFDAIGMNTFSRLRDSALFALSIDSGLRPSEALQLRPSDVDIPARRVRIRAATSKTRTSRIVFFSDRTGELLSRLISVRPEEWGDTTPIFCTCEGSTWNTHSWTVQLRRYAEKAGLPRFSSYDLRHQHAIGFLRNGGDVMTLSREMGHATLDMTRQYLNVTESDIRQGHDKASPANVLFPEKVKRMGKIR